MLKERLQKKIEAFRENRKAKERSEVAVDAKRWRDKQQQATKQRPQKRNRCAQKFPKHCMNGCPGIVSVYQIHHDVGCMKSCDFGVRTVVGDFLLKAYPLLLWRWRIYHKLLI
jgi:hypothetical protein